MKIRLLLAALLVGLCLSSCSRKDRGKQPERADSSRGATTRPSAPQKPVGPPRSIALDLGNGVTMKLVLIPKGKFMMGSKSSPTEVARKFHRYGGQEAYYTAEHPQREVTISKPFYMGVWEVTRPQWDAVMGAGPWKGKKCDNSDAGNVANHVSWADASKFCERLSKKTGKKVALPTEAQWEYACRANRKEAYSFGDDESKLGTYAWFAENALGVNEPYPHRAGLKTPNFWGLYDMHGNAAEWCADWYDEKFYASAGAKNIDPENTTAGTQRVLRGGEWGQYPDSCRSAYRSKNNPTARKCSYGFRVIVPIDTGGGPTTRRGGVPGR